MGRVARVRELCQEHLLRVPRVGEPVTWRIGSHQLSGTVVREPVVARGTPSDVYLRAAG